MLASLAREGNVFHFSGFALKMKNLSFLASEASAGSCLYFYYL
ncbi:MAG: hypothetical protein U5L45_10025 [Saprospiraceae bacterium]|nr:hypothetical protein [Saprospiraceae bacterium]